MHKSLYVIAFLVGLAVTAWVGVGFIGTSPIALSVTLLIAAVFIAGSLEVRRHRAATAGLAAALAGLPTGADDVEAWLARLPAALRPAVQQRLLLGERVALPGMALAPYLVGLLVMLGMLGTFLGMVMTFQGAVFALEGSTDLQAVRSALAAPIRGLGFSFGTSVAGVATSALLGLMVAAARRERAHGVRRLEAEIAEGALRAHSPQRRRDDALLALQRQGRALPEVAERLQVLIERIEQRSQQLDEQLLARQADFLRQAGERHDALARTLHDGLGEGLRGAAEAASATVRPLVQEAMHALMAGGERVHAQLAQVLQAQLQDLVRQWEAVGAEVAARWEAAQARHAQALAAWDGQVREALQAQAQRFEDGSARWLQATQAALGEAEARQQRQAEAARQAWARTLGEQAEALRAQWQAAGAELREGQQAVLQQLQAAVAEVAETSARQAAHVGEEVQRLVAGAEGLLQGVRAQVDEARAVLQGVTQHVDTATAGWLRATQAALAEAQVQQQRQAEVAQQVWARTLGELAESLRAQWQATGAELHEGQRAVLQRLQEVSDGVAAAATRQAAGIEDTLGRMAARTDALLAARAETEAHWREEHARRLDELAHQWREHLQALRDDEAARADAAVQRLAHLESTAAAQLAALGQALEAPLARLVATASEAPRAAAEVIARLREEMSTLAERDNAALAERERLMARLDTLLGGVREATESQRAAVEQLVGSAAQVFEQIGRRFAETVGTQAERAERLGARMDAAVADLAALGESLRTSVAEFGAANTRLADGLARVEQAIAESLARSDEQLAYYVAQAREVIDLSITAQQGVLEDLRELRRQPPAPLPAREGADA